MGIIAEGRPRRNRKRPPLRNCPECGCRFASWSEGRYCGGTACQQLHMDGPSAAPPTPSPSDYDPATAPFPDGF